MPVRHSCLAVLLLLLALGPARAQDGISAIAHMKISSSAPRFHDTREIDRTMTEDFREQLGARLAQDLNRPDLTPEQLTPRSVTFEYTGSDITGMMHATIQLSFFGSWITEENREELWYALNKKVSPGAVEVFAEHFNGLLEQQREAAEEQKKQQRDRLVQERDKLLISIEQIQGIEVEGGSAPLQAQMQELNQRLRDDEIRLIELQAQRAAIEKRIDLLRTQATEQQQEDPLLAALQGEVERLEQGLAAMRAELETNSPLEAAKKLVKVQEGLLQRANRTSGITQAERDQALAQVVQAELRLSEIMADVGSREATMEEKLAQAKIAFLQHQRTSSTGRLATQINKLSDTLDELAIELDTIAGRREGIEEALAQLRGEAAEAMHKELRRKQYDTKIKVLQQRRAQVEERLLELEGEALQASSQKLEILPVIP